MYDLGWVCDLTDESLPQNPGLAIFTLIGSQLLGYGYAGLLQDMLVKPTKCFWPAQSTSDALSLLLETNSLRSIHRQPVPGTALR